LVRRIKWELGNKQREALEFLLEEKLKVHGYKLGINSHLSCQALPHLLKKTADLLSTEGDKKLRFSDFLTSFDQATTVTIPRGMLQAMSSTSSLQQYAGAYDSVEIERLINSLTPFGRPTPIVDGGIPRTSLVLQISQILLEEHIIFLTGSSGLGKTNLASLLTGHIGEAWGWAGFRSIQPNQIKDILRRALFEINSGRLNPFLVLDDLDLSLISFFEREFITFIFSVINLNGLVVVTSPSSPPLQLLPKLWKNQTCEISVPYFDEAEVTEMVIANGVVDSGLANSWAKAIWLTTSGHPQLVHARVRNISARGWPRVAFSDLAKPEDVERVKSETRHRLVSEFPNDNIRGLAYKLSLVNGGFTRETAIAIGEAPPPTTMPGEAFDALIGPWIEREGPNRYRVSPLLTGAGNNILTEKEVNGVHGAISLSIIKRKKIDQFEVGTAFFHAFIGKHEQTLFMLSTKICTTDTKHMHLLYDAMSWFTLVGLEPKSKVFPGRPGVDLIIRLAQYKLVAASPEPDKAQVIIDRIEETLIEIESPEHKQYSEVLAYGMVLNTLDVKIPSAKVIRMLSRLIDIEDENPTVKEIFTSFDMKSDLPRIGDNKATQVLFAYQGIRVSGLDDLSVLVDSLDGLPPKKRDLLLVVCGSDLDFANLLVNRAWWREVENQALNVEKALGVLSKTAAKSREWGRPEILKACLIAKSVLHDEYQHSTESALDILDEADKEFPGDASLINQRSKVFFNSSRDNEALLAAYKALELPGLTPVEFVFTCRSSGIAAAKADNWAEAERLFRLGMDKANLSSVQKTMGIGLMADVALASGKQKNYANSLLLFAQTLDSLLDIPISGELRIRHLHASVRHCISWIHFEARGQHPSNFHDPLPGMCSNQDPHEGIKDHRIIEISAAWELLAATENILGLDLGIKSRSNKAVEGRKTIFMQGYSRTLAFEMIFKNKDFDHLVSALIALQETIHHSKSLKDEDSDDWAIGDIPKLPAGYWESVDSQEWIYHFILIASVICIFDCRTTPLPLTRWRTELANGGALTGCVSQFLEVLAGAEPDETAYQQAAAALFSFRKKVQAPSDLWRNSFRLLNICKAERRHVENAFEGLVTSRWIYSIYHQRFAFLAPSVACPEIERHCLDNTRSGLAKVSALLVAAAPYLNLALAPGVKQMLRDLIDQG
jgi:hypothetical protein